MISWSDHGLEPRFSLDLGLEPMFNWSDPEPSDEEEIEEIRQVWDDLGESTDDNSQEPATDPYEPVVQNEITDQSSDEE